MKPDHAVEKTKVLITVMTYPHPSPNYQELVCTAGITETGEWMRLYPIDYRYRPNKQKFHKYQWIEVETTLREMGKDNRKESRRPNLETIQLVGAPLGVKNGWADRRALIDALPHPTPNELKQQHADDMANDRRRTSLGVVRPTEILDLVIKPADSEWKPEWQQLLNQLRLFGPPPKPLAKIPYTFRYVFKCHDDQKPHTAMCEDWELGVLYLNEVARLGDEQLAAESVKKKFFGELCRADKDTQFFMGTKFPYNTWLVLGVFWPPKEVTKPKKQTKKPKPPIQPGLFD